MNLYGTGESLLQLVTGHGSLTGEEASRVWAAIGVVPMAGGVIRKVGEPTAHALSAVLKDIAQTGELRIASTTKLISQYSPISNPGPLPQSIANTFRSGTYVETIATEPATLYRAYGGSASQLGGCWTSTPPTGPVQSIIDSALDPSWGNTALEFVKIEVPPGVRLYQGQAASQGGLVGGGAQVLFPKNISIDPKWIKP